MEGAFMICELPPRERLRGAWVFCEKWVRAACRAAGWQVQPVDVLRRILGGEALLVTFRNNNEAVPFGCAVLDIDRRQKYIRITCVGADRGRPPPGWIGEGIAEFVRIAQAMGASELVGSGRLGWERVAKPYGFVWDDEHECYRKAVDHGRQ